MSATSADLPKNFTAKTGAEHDSQPKGVTQPAPPLPPEPPPVMPGEITQLRGNRWQFQYLNVTFTSNDRSRVLAYQYATYLGEQGLSHNECIAQALAKFPYPRGCSYLVSRQTIPPLVRTVGGEPASQKAPLPVKITQ
jgi:hypothetical protein